MNEYLKEIYTEMCRRVGTDLTEVDLTEKNWYQKYRWPIKEEVSFRDWLLNYLEKNPEAIDAIVSVGIIRHVDKKKMATEFASYFGWDHLIETEQSQN
jgi:cyclopropane fatty-acyl-phospholipid synthase-like methyltransferase